MRVNYRSANLAVPAKPSMHCFPPVEADGVAMSVSAAGNYLISVTLFDCTTHNLVELFWGIAPHTSFFNADVFLCVYRCAHVVDRHTNGHCDRAL